MDQGVGNFLLLAAILGGIALYGLRICHPARRRMRTVVFFVFAVFLVPWAAMGIAYLFYQYDNTPPFNAFIFGGFLTLFFFGFSAAQSAARRAAPGKQAGGPRSDRRRGCKGGLRRA